MEFYGISGRTRIEELQALLNLKFNMRFDECRSQAYPTEVINGPYRLAPNVCREGPIPEGSEHETCFDLWVNMNTGHRFRCDGKPFFVSGVV